MYIYSFIHSFIRSSLFMHSFLHSFTCMLACSANVWRLVSCWYVKQAYHMRLAISHMQLMVNTYAQHTE